MRTLVLALTFSFLSINVATATPFGRKVARQVKRDGYLRRALRAHKRFFGVRPTALKAAAMFPVAVAFASQMPHPELGNVAAAGVGLALYKGVSLALRTIKLRRLARVTMAATHGMKRWIPASRRMRAADRVWNMLQAERGVLGVARMDALGSAGKKRAKAEQRVQRSRERLQVLRDLSDTLH